MAKNIISNDEICVCVHLTQTCPAQKVRVEMGRKDDSFRDRTVL